MSGVLDTIADLANQVKGKAMGVVDGFFPPEKRAELITKLQKFAVANPKLSAFLLTNIALTGLPLVLFAAFTLTVIVFSLLFALIVALLVAVLFIVFMVGVALVFVLPTVFMTTMAASFIFLWGLGGYYIVKWFNEGEGAAPEGDAIGDKLNNLTGGRLSFLMDGARKKDEAEKGNSGGKGGDPLGPPNPADLSSGVDSVKKQAEGMTKRANADGVKKAANVDGVKKKVNGSTGNVAKPATDTADTVTGGVKGITGLG